MKCLLVVQVNVFVSLGNKFVWKQGSKQSFNMSDSADLLKLFNLVASATKKYFRCMNKHKLEEQLQNL